MVDFIVLGIIPGTTLQIQLSHIMLIAWIVFVVVIIKNRTLANRNK